MPDSRTLQILITAQDQASKKLEGIGGQLDKLEPSFKKMRNIGGIALGAITAEAGFALKAFGDAEVQMAKVDAILATLPASASTAVGGLSGLRQEIDKVSQANIKLAFDDEDTAESLARLTQTTGDYQEALKLNTMAMDLARFKNIDLTTATSALMKMNSGSMRELKALGITVEDNTTKEDAYRIVMEKTAGQAQAYADTVQGKTEAMKISFANLQEGIGQALTPAFNKLAETLMPVIERFSTWANNNPDLLAKIIMIGGALAGIISAIGILGMVLPSIIAGFSALGVILGILFSPIGLIIGAILALIAVGVLLYKHWDEVSAFAMNIWNGLANFFQGVWDVIKQIFSVAVALILGIVITAFDAMGIDIFDVIERIKTALTVAWDWMNGVFTKISNAIVAGFNFISSFFKTATKPLSDAWSALWGAIGGTVMSVWEGIKNTIKSGINWIIDKINWFIRKANDIAKVGANAVGIKIPAIPEIPLLAEGGIVNRPTLAMVGEAGPEAVVPLNKAGMFSGITLNISGNTVIGRNGMEELTEIIGNNLARKLNLNGVGI